MVDPSVSHEMSFCIAKTNMISALGCQLQPPLAMPEMANKVVKTAAFYPLRSSSWQVNSHLYQ